MNTLTEVKELEEFLKDHESGNPVFLPKGFTSILDIKNRILELKSKAYTLNETVGKVGVEKSFDDDLRGYRGKKHYEVDTKGHYVRMLPGSKKSIPGKKLLLNISSELQEFAEALLAENEQIREEKFPHSGKDHRFLPSPWIKGGSIVAILPKTGEVVTLASYPRMDPNDFIPAQDEIVKEEKSQHISRWLENSTYLANLWDGKAPLTRELYSSKRKQFYTEKKWLTLDSYLEMIFSKHSAAREHFTKLSTIGKALQFQTTLESLLDLSEQPNMHAVIDTLYPKSRGYLPSCFSSSEKQLTLTKEALSQHSEYVKRAKIELDRTLCHIKHNDDKLLLLDLATLFANKKYFTEELAEVVSSESLAGYRKLTQSFCILLSTVEQFVKRSFHENDFYNWREEHFKDYLKEKRKDEKKRKTYQRPYLEYLTKLEKKMFKEFWEENKLQIMLGFILGKNDLAKDLSLHIGLLLEEDSRFLEGVPFKKRNKSALRLLRQKLTKIPEEHCLEYLTTMKGYRELTYKLHGYYPQIKKRRTKQLGQDLASCFYPYSRFGYGRSYAYRQATPLGSIFKVITAYEAITQNYERGFYEGKDSLNPLTIIDEIHPSMKTPKGIVLGFHEDGKKITRRYKGGTLPRSHASLGKVDFFKAMERSSNIYFSLLASDVINEPNDLVLTSLKFGFGNKTGIDLPYEIPGVLPKDLSENRSGLYAFAIGQHSLIATPLQTSMMLSSLVNGGELLKPQILKSKTGASRRNSLFQKDEKAYPYDNILDRVGIFFPFFLETQKDDEAEKELLTDKTLYRKLYLPKEIKDYLIQSLHNVVSSPIGAARAAIIRYLYGNRAAKREYLKLKNQFAGKTSSAEIAYNPTLDREMPPIKCKDVWFGGISFLPSKEKEEEPELVVVVYLKFGDYGKEAAPLAGQIITKWRELCEKHF
ncbi:MAG: Peptidoglycan D,D-transpeptidase MrdA [Chlamydiia bacterium]|nr:Peptidoglycan D,D-transpeptidase MrdA [Chlamydiia bacterium]